MLPLGEDLQHDGGGEATAECLADLDLGVRIDRDRQGRLRGDGGCGRTGTGWYESELQQRAEEELKMSASTFWSSPRRLPSAAASATLAI